MASNNADLADAAPELVATFRADAARTILSRTRIDGLALDVEIFSLVEHYRLSLTEVSVALRPSVVTTVRIGVHTVKMVRDLVRIRRWANPGAYQVAAEDAVIGQGGRESIRLGLT